jgi:translocation and assembly module TamB
MEASGLAELPGSQMLEIGLLARGDDSGTTVERLSLGGWEAPPLTGEGHLPLVLEIGGASVARLLPETSLDFRVRHEPVENVSVDLGRTGKFQLSRPLLDLRISGSVDQPRGEFIAALDGVEAAGDFPRVERARIEVALQPRLVQLKQFDFVLEGQPVSVSGELPLTGDDLFDFGAIAPDWLGATGRVSIQDAEVSPVARRLPNLLTAQGRLGLDLVLRPGLMMDGFLSLTNAMSRPLGPLAPVREVDTLIAFSGRTARIERFAGRLGGRPIHAAGEASLDDDGRLSYGLRIQATNAPLVRRPGLLVRADLDLALENRGGDVPTVSGKVGLRDGLLLQDVSSLLVDRLERPALRPPYFSVTNQPFARWNLNVDVTGDRFLRLRSPAFIGEVSANGSLRGTLGKPVVRADVRVPRGRLLFPFGKLEVEGAYITVSGEQPAGPMIDFVAAGQNYNYNVRLEATGTMDNLNILFTSTPPLSSEDILLMLTAGELPNQEITYSAEARAGRLITYLGREVATRFFGNELGEERLIVNSGENIARNGQTTYSIEYRLSPRWSLVGEYDEFNALNAGLKFRVFAR